MELYLFVSYKSIRYSKTKIGLKYREVCERDTSLLYELGGSMKVMRRGSDYEEKKTVTMMKTSRGEGGMRLEEICSNREVFEVDHEYRVCGRMRLDGYRIESRSESILLNYAEYKELRFYFFRFRPIRVFHFGEDLGNLPAEGCGEYGDRDIGTLRNTSRNVKVSEGFLYFLDCEKSLCCYDLERMRDYLMAKKERRRDGEKEEVMESRESHKTDGQGLFVSRNSESKGYGFSSPFVKNSKGSLIFNQDYFKSSLTSSSESSNNSINSNKKICDDSSKEGENTHYPCLDNYYPTILISGEKISDFEVNPSFSKMDKSNPCVIDAITIDGYLITEYPSRNLQRSIRKILIPKIPDSSLNIWTVIKTLKRTSYSPTRMLLTSQTIGRRTAFYSIIPIKSNPRRCDGRDEEQREGIRVVGAQESQVESSVMMLDAMVVYLKRYCIVVFVRGCGAIDVLLQRRQALVLVQSLDSECVPMCCKVIGGKGKRVSLGVGSLSHGVVDIALTW